VDLPAVKGCGVVGVGGLGGHHIGRGGIHIDEWASRCVVIVGEGAGSWGFRYGWRGLVSSVGGSIQLVWVGVEKSGLGAG
jgi:hypothetical protein